MDNAIKYFPCPSGLTDSKVWSAITGEFGAKGGVVFLSLVCTVFKNGYFIYWDERAKQTISASTQASQGLVQHVVDRLVQLQVFDANSLINCGVITSKDIQNIYITQKHLTNEVANNLQYRLEYIPKNSRRFDFQGVTGCKEKETEKENSPHTPYKEKEKEKEALFCTTPKCLKKNARENFCEEEADVEHRTQNAEHRTQNTEQGTQNAERRTFKPPSIEEIEAYLQQKEITAFTAKEFYNFYESKGWMIGKNKMKNWHSAVQTWLQRAKVNNTSITKNSNTNGNKRNYQERLF